jgi:hypothetical protein
VRRDVAGRAVESHLVGVGDEVAHDAACLLDVGRSLVAELLPLQRFVPAFERAVALRAGGARANMRDPGQADDRWKSMIACFSQTSSQPSRGMWALWACGLPECFRQRWYLLVGRPIQPRSCLAGSSARPVHLPT